MTCPTCRQDTEISSSGVASLQPAFYIDNLLEIHSSFKAAISPTSPDPSRCYITGERFETVLVGENTVILQAINFEGNPCEDEIKSLQCDLVSEMKGTRVRCSVGRRGEITSQYEISCQPAVKGMHKLHVKVEGHEIRGSPFSFVVKLAVEKLSAPILTLFEDNWRKPDAVAINQRGEMVVVECDRNNYYLNTRISMFSPNGKLLRSLSVRYNNQHIEYPQAVAFDGKGNILLVDDGRYRIQKYTVHLEFLTAVDSECNGPLQDLMVHGVAYNASNDKVYLLVYGKVKRDLGTDIVILNSDLTFFGNFWKSESDKVKFTGPRSIACDSTGRVYVADPYAHHVQVFTAEGAFLRKFGGGGWSIAVESSALVYVGDVRNNCVSVFTPEGQFITSFGVVEPYSIAVNDSGLICVCTEGTVKVF